jgi:hypothetical protein
MPSAAGQNYKHRQLATEYGVRGYVPGGTRRVPKSRGERLAERCAEKTIAHRAPSLFADPPSQAFVGELGQNACVLLQVLTNNGARFDGMFVKASEPGGKAWGRIEKERRQSLARNDRIGALELHEHSLVARTQIHGFWSDAVHSDVEYVSADDVLELVRDYNSVAPTADDPQVALGLMRKAERLTADPALVSRSRENRQLRCLTHVNIAALCRRRGRLQEALRQVLCAEVVMDTLGKAPGAGRTTHTTSPHAVCVLCLRAEGLLNLDDNALGGLSDPFLRISRLKSCAHMPYLAPYSHSPRPPFLTYEYHSAARLVAAAARRTEEDRHALHKLGKVQVLRRRARNALGTATH